MMSFPVIVSFFGHDLYLHTIMETVGIFIGMRLYYFLKRKSGAKVGLEVSLAVLLGALFGALIGSKLIGNLEDPSQLLSGEMTIKDIWERNTIVGGLAFGLLGVEIAKKLVGHHESTGDLMVFPLITAIIIGRIGCSSMGIYEQTYGIETSLFTGMYLGDNLLRHPVSLYEILFLLLLAVFLLYVKRNFVYDSGSLFQLFMLFYFVFRFCLDFIKPKIVVFAGLGTIQVVCVCMVIYYLYKINYKLFNYKQAAV